MTNPTAELIAEWQRAAGEDELANIHPLIRAGNALAAALEQAEDANQQLTDATIELGQMNADLTNRLASLAPVSVKERMPMEKDADYYGDVLVRTNGGSGTWYSKRWQNVDADADSHWCRVPEIKDAAIHTD